MHRFITHESLAVGLFNRDHCGATALTMAWQGELQNSTAILSLLCERMRSDYLGLHTKMRKAWTLKDLDTKLERINICLWYRE